MKNDIEQELSQPDKEELMSQWFGEKIVLHKIENVPYFSEGEIWWCGCGENVGTEINGKSQYFSRPCVILRKLSRGGFMGIPLTSQEHHGSWYVEFSFRNKTSYAALCQARMMSAKRLYRRMGRLDEVDMLRLREGFAKLYL